MRDENKQSSKKEETFNLQRFLKKRWALPAIYLAVAALLLSAFFFMQSQNGQIANPDDPIDVEENPNGPTGMHGEDAVPVTTDGEVVKLPISDENEVEIVGTFYDVNGTAEEQQAALVYYNNYYYQNKGIDLAKDGEESFDVTAALSGTVVKAEQDSLLGYVVEVDHDNGIVTHYHSLGELNVEQGDTVRQGDILGSAGRNLYNENAGVHVHFEIRKDGIAINPEDALQQPVSFLEDLEGASEEATEGEDEKESEDARDGEGEGEDESDREEQNDDVKEDTNEDA
ncbi:M23 family peptidase [Halalkalibacterium halodurans]|uniref:M23 family metallopeptidase n=1 Tax=Halalkalibacterium halodurans TaxID=86665 RepID=UPI001067BA3F|nr:M23 family metallopeptidase [Halalkalibacterium halodurans]TES53626.1 M23 family peptidase [Halalkalibacterium halodurans]